jgi:hypothetical protein
VIRIKNLGTITDDENDLLLVLAIESCVWVGLSRLLRKKYKESEKFF